MAGTKGKQGSNIVFQGCNFTIQLDGRRAGSRKPKETKKASVQLDGRTKNKRKRKKTKNKSKRKKTSNKKETDQWMDYLSFFIWCITSFSTTRRMDYPVQGQTATSEEHTRRESDIDIPDNHAPEFVPQSDAKQDAKTFPFITHERAVFHGRLESSETTPMANNYCNKECFVDTSLEKPDLTSALNRYITDPYHRPWAFEEDPYVDFYSSDDDDEEEILERNSQTDEIKIVPQDSRSLSDRVCSCSSNGDSEYGCPSEAVAHNNLDVEKNRRVSKSGPGAQPDSSQKDKNRDKCRPCSCTHYVDNQTPRPPDTYDDYCSSDDSWSGDEDEEFAERKKIIRAGSCGQSAKPHITDESLPDDLALDKKLDYFSKCGFLCSKNVDSEYGCLSEAVAHNNSYFEESRGVSNPGSQGKPESSQEDKNQDTHDPENQPLREEDPHSEDKRSDAAERQDSVFYNSDDSTHGFEDDESLEANQSSWPANSECSTSFSNTFELIRLCNAVPQNNEYVEEDESSLGRLQSNQSESRERDSPRKLACPGKESVAVTKQNHQTNDRHRDFLHTHTSDDSCDRHSGFADELCGRGDGFHENKPSETFNDPAPTTTESPSANVSGSVDSCTDVEDKESSEGKLCNRAANSKYIFTVDSLPIRNAIDVSAETTRTASHREDDSEPSGEPEGLRERKQCSCTANSECSSSSLNAVEFEHVCQPQAMSTRKRQTEEKKGESEKNQNQGNSSRSQSNDLGNVRFCNQHPRKPNLSSKVSDLDDFSRIGDSFQDVYSGPLTPPLPKDTNTEEPCAHVNGCGDNMLGDPGSKPMVAGDVPRERDHIFDFLHRPSQPDTGGHIQQADSTEGTQGHGLWELRTTISLNNGSHSTFEMPSIPSLITSGGDSCTFQRGASHQTEVKEQVPTLLDINYSIGFEQLDDSVPGIVNPEEDRVPRPEDRPPEEWPPEYRPPEEWPPQYRPPEVGPPQDRPPENNIPFGIKDKQGQEEEEAGGRRIWVWQRRDDLGNWYHYTQLQNDSIESSYRADDVCSGRMFRDWRRVRVLFRRKMELDSETRLYTEVRRVSFTQNQYTSSLLAEDRIFEGDIDLRQE